MWKGEWETHGREDRNKAEGRELAGLDRDRDGEGGGDL